MTNRASVREPAGDQGARHEGAGDEGGQRPRDEGRRGETDGGAQRGSSQTADRAQDSARRSPGPAPGQ